MAAKNNVHTLEGEKQTQKLKLHVAYTWGGGGIESLEYGLDFFPVLCMHDS